MLFNSLLKLVEEAVLQALVEVVKSAALKNSRPLSHLSVRVELRIALVCNLGPLSLHVSDVTRKQKHSSRTKRNSNKLL